MSTLRQAVMYEIAKDMEDKSSYVTAGKCKDYTDYRACCAELVGMHNATQLFLDIEKRHNDNDEES